MNMTNLSLIKSNDVAALSQYVFKQNLGEDEGGYFTRALSAEEELSVVDQFLTTKSAEWLEFLQNYVGHYPLFAASVIKLSTAFAELPVQTFLMSYIKRYGANEGESLALSRQLAKNPDDALLQEFCACGRHYYDTTSYELSKIDDKWAALYKDNCEKYHQNFH